MKDSQKKIAYASRKCGEKMDLQTTIFIMYGALTIIVIEMLVYINWKYLTTRRYVFKRENNNVLVCLLLLIIDLVYASRQHSIGTYMILCTLTWICVLLNVYSIYRCRKQYYSEKLWIMVRLMDAKLDTDEYRNLDYENREKYMRNIFSDYIVGDKIMVNGKAVCKVSVLLKELEAIK